MTAKKNATKRASTRPTQGPATPADSRSPPQRPAILDAELELGVLGDNIGFMTRVVRTVVQQSAVMHMRDSAFAPGQVTLLGLIAMNEGVSQNRIATAVVQKRSQVTVLIQDLVQRGLVDRQEMSSDRRFNSLFLTAEGKRAWKEARDRIAHHNDTVLAGLSAKERSELFRLMHKVLATYDPRTDPMTGAAEGAAGA